MKKSFIILLLLLGIGISNDYLAQTGGKKRERSHARRSLFRRTKSAGNADEFANGGGKRGFFSRLFKKDPSAWNYRSSGSAKNNYRDNRTLFSRFRTKGKQSNAEIQARQNRERAKRRVRGNKVFAKKKY